MRPPGLIARLSFRCGRARALRDAGDMLDELAGAVDGLTVEEIKRDLRLGAGVVRAQAGQLRNDSGASVGP